MWHDCPINYRRTIVPFSNAPADVRAGRIIKRDEAGRDSAGVPCGKGSVAHLLDCIRPIGPC